MYYIYIYIYIYAPRLVGRAADVRLEPQVAALPGVVTKVYLVVIVITLINTQ